MSTDVDGPTTPPAARSARYVWLAVLLVCALGALFAVHRLGLLGGESGSDVAAPDDFRAQLDARVIGILEQTPTSDHGHGDHGDTAADARLVCGVRVFGLNPPDADSLPEVAQAYGYHMCAVAEPNRPWILAVKLTGPMVVTLAADPPTVTVAEGGEGFRERVQKIIPERYQAEAFNENLDPDDMAELQRRYEEAAEA